jgi:hypothetical protein
VTLPLVSRYVDEIVTVDDEEIASAILMLLEQEKTLAEGAGAAALAALLAGKDQPAPSADGGAGLRRQHRRDAAGQDHCPRPGEGWAPAAHPRLSAGPAWRAAAIDGGAGAGAGEHCRNHPQSCVLWGEPGRNGDRCDAGNARRYAHHGDQPRARAKAGFRFERIL